MAVRFALAVAVALATAAAGSAAAQSTRLSLRRIRLLTESQVRFFLSTSGLKRSVGVPRAKQQSGSAEDRHQIG